MAIKKLCSKTGCNRVVNADTKYCIRHSEIDKERYRAYQRRRLLDEEQKKFQDFYISKAWKRLRPIIINDLLGLDLYEYYINNRIVAGECIHHIIELNEDWGGALDADNLIYLTEKNHRRIHRAYELDYKKRKSMQKLLFDLLKRFHKEFL